MTTRRESRRVVTITPPAMEAKVANAKATLVKLRQERDLILTVPRLEAQQAALQEELYQLREKLRLEREAFELDFEHERQGIQNAQAEAEKQRSLMLKAANEEVAKANQQLAIRTQAVEAEEKRIEGRLAEARSVENQAEQKLAQAETKLADASKIEAKAKTVAEQVEFSRIDVENRWVELDRARVETEADYAQNKERAKELARTDSALAIQADKIRKLQDAADQREKQSKQMEAALRVSASDMSKRLAELDKREKHLDEAMATLKAKQTKLQEYDRDLQRQTQVMTVREKRNLIMEADLKAERNRVEQARDEARKLFLLLQESKQHGGK